MVNKLIQKILPKLDHSISEYVVRDIGLLSASIFNKARGKDISFHFWFMKKNGQANIYRPGHDYAVLSKRMGQKYLRSNIALKRDTQILTKLTEDINQFINKNKELATLKIKWSEFYKIYFAFLTLHMKVYWASTYLLAIKDNNKSSKKIKNIINKLDKAFSYSETLTPRVENYFQRLNIRHFSHEEVTKATRVPKNRSILQLGGKSIILTYNEAVKINKAIQDDYKKFLRKQKGMSGLPVSKGIVTGKVRVIKDFTNFKNLKIGEILVAHQTRPKYNQYLKRAAAIVTTEGSLLCHASIISREFKIPGIVGVKNAVINLKTGDQVEVDANKGIINKI